METQFPRNYWQFGGQEVVELECPSELSLPSYLLELVDAGVSLLPWVLTFILKILNKNSKTERWKPQSRQGTLSIYTLTSAY